MKGDLRCTLHRIKPAKAGQPQGFIRLKRQDKPADKKISDRDIWNRLLASFTTLSIERRAAIFLVLILLFAALLRLIALSNWGDSLYADFLLWDERIYDDWAQQAALGAITPFPVAEFAALPAYLMVFVYKFISPDPFFIRLLNILCGLITCWLIYKIGAELGGRQIGMAAALLACLYKPFIFFNVTILKESLGIFLFAAVIYLLLTILRRPDTWRILLLAIAAGLLANVRQNAIVLIPWIGLLIAWAAWRDGWPWMRSTATATLFVVGLALSLAPFLAAQYRLTGEMRPTAAGGFNLYLANNPDNPLPYYRPASFASSVPAEQAVQFTIEASRRTGKKLSPQEASDFWTRAVVKDTLARPAAFAVKLGQKTLTLFNAFEGEDNYHIGFMGRFIPFFYFPLPGLALLLPFGMAGIIFCARSRATFAVISIAGLYALTLIVFFTNMRIGIPLAVILIPFTVLGIADLWRWFRERRTGKIIAFGAVAAAFLMIEFIPVAGTGDMTAYYNAHAINLASKGFEPEAVRYWQESAGMNRPYSAYANHALAAVSLRRGDLEAGKHYLAQIPDTSFVAAQKYELLGDILWREGRTNEAVAAYRRSLSINAGQRPVYMKMIRIFETINPSEATRLRQQLAWVASFYPAER
jgi:4-amino-4-deoxy-L-arabinose transferase-like glycosyltransferase